MLSRAQVNNTRTNSHAHPTPHAVPPTIPQRHQRSQINYVYTTWKSHALFTSLRYGYQATARIARRHSKTPVSWRRLLRRRLAHRLSCIVTTALQNADGVQNTDAFRGEVATGETATMDGAVKHEVRFILLIASMQNAKYTNRVARSPLKNI